MMGRLFALYADGREKKKTATERQIKKKSAVVSAGERARSVLCFCLLCSLPFGFTCERVGVSRQPRLFMRQFKREFISRRERSRNEVAAGEADEQMERKGGSSAIRSR